MKAITTKSGTTIDSTVNGELGPKPNIYAVARIADGTERTLEYLQCVTFAITAQAAIDRARSLHADMRQERLYALPIWSEIGKRLVEMQGMSVTEMIARSALHESRIVADRLKARRRRTRKARKADAERVAVAGPKAPKAPAEVEAPEADDEGAVGEPAPRKARKPKAEAPAASGAAQVVEHALQEQERRAAAVEAALAAERAERAEANGNPRAAETHRKIEASKRSARARFAADESAALAAKAGELLTAEGEPAAPVRKARSKRA